MEILDGWTRPTGAQLRAAGYDGKIAYLLGSLAKDATRVEFVEALDAETVFALIAEGNSNDLGFGRGTDVGRAAEAQATGIGWPEDRCIYYGADRYVGASAFPAVGADLDRIRAVSHRPEIGLYGGARLVQWALANGHADFGWIAGASSWSDVSTTYPNGKHKTDDELVAEMVALAPLAHMIQRIGYVTVAGHTCDRNTILRPDFGQLPRPPADDPIPDPEEEPMTANLRLYTRPEDGVVFLVDVEAWTKRELSSPIMLGDLADPKRLGPAVVLEAGQIAKIPDA